MKKKHVLVLLFFLGILTAFKELAFDGFVKPVNFPEPVYDVTKNPVSRQRFELGRKLFYETALSRDNTISCGSCHIQSAAFTQHGHDVSHGVDDQLGTRNSPPIMNLAWNESFLWDGGVFHLDLQPIVPITNPVEMDEKMENVLCKLRAMPSYRAKFREVYGTDEITGPQVFKALSQFMIMCVSSDSKYDSVMRHTGASFTRIEQEGYVLFQRNCSSCHKEPLFTDGSFRYNGLDNQFNPDSGRQAITLDPLDRYKFKVPSLRNLTYTAPYMHDGRFNRMEEVLDHYVNGIHEAPNLDTVLMRNGVPGIPLSGQDKIRLTAFLKTLDDKYFISRKDLSEEQ